MIKHNLIILFFLVVITTLLGCNKENDKSTLVDNETSAQIIVPESAAAKTDDIDSTNVAAAVTATNENIEIDEAKLLRKGKILFLQCRACHTLEADGDHLVGPNLNALFDSQAGMKPDFAYSEEMSGSNIKWNEDTLDQFLIKPSEYVPGTIMAFVGVEKPEDRAAIILYLKNNT